MHHLTTFFSRRSTAVVSLVALVVGVIPLAGCAAGVGKSGVYVGAGPAAESLQRHGTEIQQEGTDSGNPLQTIIGSVLSLVGGVGVSLFGANKIAAGKVAKHDAAPFTAEDVASLEAAKAAPPPAKPSA